MALESLLDRLSFDDAPTHHRAIADLPTVIPPSAPWPASSPGRVPALELSPALASDTPAPASRLATVPEPTPAPASRITTIPEPTPAPASRITPAPDSQPTPAWPSVPSLIPARASSAGCQFDAPCAPEPPVSKDRRLAPPDAPTQAADRLPPPCDLPSLVAPGARVDARPAPGSIRRIAMNANAPQPPATWAPGASIPGTVYRVIRPLGVGGMGEVYEAEHELLGVRRALKVLSRRLASREDLAERLRIEARALARLRHPNLVEVNDLGMSSDGRVFFAMELLAGATLRDLIRRTGRFRVDQAIVITTQILDALDAAHQEGMVHRDVKPENVFVLRSGVVKLLDFGVAKALQGNVQVSPLTAVGVAIGTPRYMSPEQAQGQPVDRRCDVYAVGLLLWELLDGRPPYHDLDALAALVRASSEGLPDIGADGGPMVPDDVKAALARATARLPEDRYPSAAAFAADLRLALGHQRGSSPALDKIAAPHESSLTSLAPILGDMLDGEHDTTVDDPVAFAATATRSSNTTVGGYAQVRTAELSISDPTEALLLRDSLPFDARELPTPTSIPAPAPLPASPAPAPAAPPAPAPSRAPWIALPIAMALTALATWGLVRPAPPDASAPPVAPVASVAPAASVAEPVRVATPPALPSATEAPAASVAPTAPASVAASPSAKGPAKVAGKPGAKAPERGKLALPGSGL